jgi:hypothetical protein
MKHLRDKSGEPKAAKGETFTTRPKIKVNLFVDGKKIATCLLSDGFMIGGGGGGYNSRTNDGGDGFCYPHSFTFDGFLE